MPEWSSRATPVNLQVAEGLRRRDSATLARLHADYGPTVMGFLVRALPDRATAEDVFQAVFLQVWQRGGTYDPSRGSPLSWIMTIARSRAIDHLRRLIPEPHDPTGHALSTLAGHGDPASDVDALVEQWRLAHLLAQLPEEERAMLRRRFYDGRSQREIADETGVPLGTVKMRMVQGLTRLRTMIEAEGP
jgi:RNA polymerase sigma-70 factor (ECF subfamily)